MKRRFIGTAGHVSGCGRVFIIQKRRTARIIRTRESYDSGAIAAYAGENFSPSAIAGQLTAIYKELISC